MFFDFNIHECDDLLGQGAQEVDLVHQRGVGLEVLEVGQVLQ